MDPADQLTLLSFCKDTYGISLYSYDKNYDKN